jgi:hypothetical protein
MKRSKLKLLTVPKKKRLCCAPRVESTAQCCAKASRLVAGCHD